MMPGSAAASAVAEDRFGGSLEGRRVLVVEDAFPVAELIDGMLTSLRCEVVGPVGRLDQAIRLAREERLDGAVLDVNIGGRDVVPVADELEARGVPFFFATGYDGLADLPPKYYDRPNLKKPFAVRDFSEMVAKVFL